MTKGDDHEHRRWLALAHSVAVEEPSARHGLAVLLHALEHECLNLADLEGVLDASRHASWGGVGFEEFRIEPDWRDARRTRVRVSLLGEEVVCARMPFLNAVGDLCRALRTAPKPGFILIDSATGAVYDLPRGAPVVLGRKPPADLVVPNPIVARRHLRFDWEDDRCAVNVLDAPGGVYLNGRRVVGEVPLRPGDELDLGGGICLRVSDAPLQRPVDPPKAGS